MSARMSPGCQARQASDEMRCGPCGLVWDVNDPDPPHCGRISLETLDSVDPLGRGVRRGAVTCGPNSSVGGAGGGGMPARVAVDVPLELPLELVDRMAAAYGNAAHQWDEESAGNAARRGMRAAWRVFLDASA